MSAICQIELISKTLCTVSCCKIWFLFTWNILFSYFFLFIYFIFSVLCVCGSFELLNLALFSLTLYQCNSCFLFLSLLFSSFYFL